MKAAIKSVTWLELFVLLSLIITGSFFVCNLAEGKGTLYSKLVIYGLDGGDYFVHIGGSSQPKELYHRGGEWFCFPPLAYCMYYLLWRTTDVQSDDVLDRETYRESNASLLIYVAYNVLQMFLLIYCVLLLYKKMSFLHAILLPAAIFLSYPFFCTSVQLGNSVALTAILLTLAVALMETGKKAQSEIALLLIAVAAGLKFVPAIYGLILVKNKDWKRMLRLILYGLVLLFVPFVFFDGIEGAKALFETLTSVATRAGDMSSFKDFVLMQIWGHFPFLLPYADLAATIAQYAFLLVCIACFFGSQTKWQGFLFLGGVMASYLTSSGRYTCAYYLPALLMFFYENKTAIVDQGRGQKLWLGANLTGLTLIFSIPFFFLFLTLPPPPMITGVYYVTYALLLGNAIQVAVSTLKGRKLLAKQQA